MTQSESTPTVTYIHPDHLGSTAVETDDTGAVTKTLDYYPYGATRISSGSSLNKRDYIGQFSDDSGLNYLNARYYDAARGQFTSQDPVFWEIGLSKDGRSALSNPQALNSYGYANGNPIANKDPYGRNPFLVVGAAAFVGSVTWDLGADVYSNLKNSSVPWYAKLNPQDTDAALRYNRDAYGAAAVAMAATAAELAAAPALAGKFITKAGSRVIASTAGGLANATDAWLRADPEDPNSAAHRSDLLFANFASGFAGTSLGMTIPNPRGAPPTTFAGSIAGARASTEQIRAQLGQLVQALTNLIASLKSAPAPQTKQ